MATGESSNLKAEAADEEISGLERFRKKSATLGKVLIAVKPAVRFADGT